MRVVVAPDKFKGSLSAAQVAAAVAAGIRSVRPDRDVVSAPVADGGDGTVDAFVAAGWERVAVRATGPTGHPHETSYARRDAAGVVELASVVGLAALPGGRPAPLQASTFGLGEVIGAARAAGVRELSVGVGGSASTDGGAGLLQALGARLTDRAGRRIGPGAAGLADLVAVDIAGLPTDVRIELAADVDNPLTGPNGAVAVFGAQKGITDPAPVQRSLQHWADLLGAATGRDLRTAPGAGAAGGTGFALLAALGAQFRPGIDVVLARTGLRDVLRDADLVITGEGSLDEQTLSGKAPVGVARAAGSATVVAVAGRNLLSVAQARAAGFAAVYPLTELQPDPVRSMRDAAALLHRIGARIATDFGPDQPASNRAR
ncbi:glycerate kinase [Skermania piniformis]